MKTYYLKSGNHYRVTSEEALDIHETLPARNYTIQFNPMMGFYLEESESFVNPKKIYGGLDKVAHRILHTFKDRGRATGVLLVGEKGSGKSLLAKLVSNFGIEKGIPVLLVNSPYIGEGFNTFLSAITQPCIVVFDEFEKVYDKDHQPQLLTLFDGVFSGNKLFMLTANDQYKVDSHMRNRPGRLYYAMDFDGLSLEFIREYCEDTLNNKSYLDQVLIVATMFEKFNFDMLQSLVEEMNRYDESPQEVLKILNVKPDLRSSDRFQITLFINGVELSKKDLADTRWQGNPLSIPEDGIEIYYKGEKYNKQDDDGEISQEWDTTIFDSKMLVRLDMSKGVYFFKNEGHELILTKQKPEVFDFNRYLTL